MQMIHFPAAKKDTIQDVDVTIAEHTKHVPMFQSGTGGQTGMHRLSSFTLYIAMVLPWHLVCVSCRIYVWHWLQGLHRAIGKIVS